MKPGAYIEVAPGPLPAVDRTVEVCPTCKAGRLEKNIASMPNECCAIYFCGQGSEMHMQWRWQAMSSEERARRIAAFEKLAAERMAADDDDPSSDWEAPPAAHISVALAGVEDADWVLDEEERHL